MCNFPQFLYHPVKHYQVRLYQPQDFSLWNTFISFAKNATFLFHRNFMDYHSDRFEDYSLIVLDGEKVVAVLPANRVGDTVYSHQGLTYGGLVLNKKAKLSAVISIFKCVLEYLNENSIDKLTVKNVPNFYSDFFSEELEYCLFILNSRLYRKDALSVIDLSKDFFLDNNRMEGVKKGMKKELIIKEETTFDLFWNEILIPNLELKHQAKPVHSLSEITKLKNYFPNNIRQFNVYEKDVLIAGTTIFVNNNVVHSQYISGNETKKITGSLDYLFHHLIMEVFKDKNFFDFGTSNESEGRKMNLGLLFWKESFGAKTVVQNFYEVETKNYSILEAVLL
ncbi:GNAT family N-acetyltransferase [Flavobacterium sp.]|uniref:GNAT family N-acetyltransferase n=1 Tax=Flavobacterium sp. TaxID=239 RepID=UPI003BC53778